MKLTSISDKKGEITLHGEITIELVGTFRDLLLKALSNFTKVVVQCRDITFSDLTCLQVLCAAQSSAREFGKELSLENQSESLNRIIQSSGFAKCRCCDESENNVCLWQGDKGESQ
ncbi:STAS domain-containing protein [Thermodesulfobacteriota bacterium]